MNKAKLIEYTENIYQKTVLQRQLASGQPRHGRAFSRFQVLTNLLNSAPKPQG